MIGYREGAEAKVINYDKRYSTFNIYNIKGSMQTSEANFSQYLL